MAKNSKKKGGKKKGHFHTNPTQSTKQTQKKLNPFEVRYQSIKKRQSVPTNKKLLQQLKTKKERVSKREKALLGELKALNKPNRFVDRRQGPPSSGLQGSEKHNRHASHESKRVRFDTSDSKAGKPLARDTLTHFGVPLDSEDSKAFDDEPIDDSSDFEDTGFEQSGSRNESQKKSSLQVTLDEIIRNSKKLKAEKQLENERNFKLIDQLDAEWKSLCRNAVESVKLQQMQHAHEHDAAEDKTTSTNGSLKSDEKKLPEVKSSIVARLAVSAKPAANATGKIDPAGKSSKQPDAEDDTEFDTLLRELRNDMRSKPLASSNQISNEIEKKRAALLRSIGTGTSKNVEPMDISVDRALYAAPTCFEDLRATLAARSYGEQVELLDSLTVLHYPSHVAPANRLISQRLFLYALMYVADLSKAARDSEGAGADTRAQVVFLDRAFGCLLRLFAVPQLTNTCVTILFRSLENAHRVVRKRIKQRARIVSTDVDADADIDRHAQLIGVEICWLLRVSLMLFERTPSYVKLSVRVTAPVCDILRSVEPLLASDRLTTRELTAIIFLQTLLIEHVERSENCYIPELLRSARLVLLATSIKLKKLSDGLPRTTTTGTADSDRIELASLLGVSDRRNEPQLVRGCAMAALRVVSSLANAYRTLPSFATLFDAVWSQLAALRTAFGERDSVALHKIDAVVAECSGEKHEAPLVALKFDRERKMLQQFEPRLNSKFTGSDVQSDRERRTKATRAHKTLLRKAKLEEKGAMRELRRDASVLRRVAINEQRRKDTDRRRKVKRILGDLGQQEGDFRALKRGKGDEAQEDADADA